MSTTDENDKLEIPAGTTAKGGELVIVPTKTGLYRIEYRGVGAAPAFTNQIFTSLLLANRALDNYRRANAAVYAKEAFKRQLAEQPSIKERRKQAALALKNGEITEPDDEEE